MKSLTKTVRSFAAANASRSRPLVASLTQAFDWAYRKAIDGIPGFTGAEELAGEYAARHASLDDAAKALTATHARMAGVSGFATGCGGFVALPIALPANVASALYLQTRLVAAIAHLHGHDIRSPRVRMLVLACLSGSKAAETLRDAGIRFGTRLGRDAVGWAAPALFNKSRHAGHLAVLGLAGSRGIAGLGRFVPLFGGLVAGGFDAALTHMIGRTANRVFGARRDTSSQAVAQEADAGAEMATLAPPVS
ncbi:MAG TPA: EcsC family protein [Stellaceae bacterium]|nr:EcsC family protein [Stellaceae bacterium]